jgi:hypothetical protein
VTRTALLPAVLLAALFSGCAAQPGTAAGKPAAPGPTPTPAALPPDSENPEDVRARIPMRPTPPQPENKFPPPQQSEEEEQRTSNAPGEPDLLHMEPSVLLDGKPFPERTNYEPGFPDARRLRYVSATAAGPGDGSFERPWRDLQDALCRLEPGDRLVVSADVYEGSFRVGGPCRSGTEQLPIQVFARHAFLKPAGSGDVLTIERAHWQFWELQIALLDSDVAGLVVSGTEAHDIAVDQTHIYEGNGPAVRVAAGSSRVTFSNCHIHQSRGVRIESGASEIVLVNNHIHHNRSASVAIGGGRGLEPARDLKLVGNRIHNDHGPALELSACYRVTVTRNRFSNYRPNDEGEGGEAVVVGSGCRTVTFEANSVLEASVAARVGDASSSGAPSEGLVFQRNYLENRLTADATAFRLLRGKGVRVANNVIDRYAEPFWIGSSGLERVEIANNLAIKPRIAFALGALSSVAFFDYNVFGADPSLPAMVGQGSEGASWISRMPHSRIVPGADLSGGDLSRIVGFSPVDAGKALEGMGYRGAAPDIGVAER